VIKVIDEKTFTVTQIAEYFNVTPQTVHNWIKRGEIEAIEISPVSRRKKISISALQRFAEPRRLDISGLNDREGRQPPYTATTI
jgi:excisionase family DNA binding protein